MFPTGPGKSPLPVLHLDVTKRFDIYVHAMGEERVYENVRLTAIRTYEETSDGLPSFGGFLEIESTNGNRMMIPRDGIHAICEHAIPLAYKVTKSRRRSDDEPS